jgi:hypothetical protein
VLLGDIQLNKREDLAAELMAAVVESCFVCMWPWFPTIYMFVLINDGCGVCLLVENCRVIAAAEEINIKNAILSDVTPCGSC